jgi:hypothetical protein
LTLAETAHRYRAAGLSVLPAKREGEQKRVALRAWKPYQARLPTEAEVGAWFANGHAALCLVCGAVSGALEMIDFDLAGEAFPAWRDLVRESAPELLDRLVIESTPSGGRHVIYRCEAQVCGNLKLAQRRLAVPDGEPIVVAGKTFVPRRQPDGTWSVLLTLIETRSEGGIFLCAPSEGYELLQGDLAAPPVLTADEREALLAAAWALNKVVPNPEPIPATGANVARPGDAYAKRGDVRDVLRRHGWTLARPAASGGDGNEYWRRPGKTDGWSATLKDMSGSRVFYVFSSNAAPFEPGKAYGPFAVYSLLKHNGDFAAAARALRAEGYGDDAGDDHVVADIGGILGQLADTEPAEPQAVDPGPMPDELLRVPGFVAEVMDYCLATAPYPNPVMAFCGALALQAFLAGRRVRDPADNRTNIYLLGLAHSAAGKDHPRKVNTRIVHEIGLSECLGDRFASGEGVQDALFVNPSMLFQTDEIDGMLQSINKAKDARHENVMSTLLTMYSSSNSVFPMRRKAGKPSPGVIDQPCLVIFGTAIPNHYYEALSERMLTNGFFARMVILESGPRSKGQEPGIIELPPRVLETAHWWANYRPGRGNLQDWHPVPAVVHQTGEALAQFVATREEAEAKYAAAEANNDPVGTTVWGRVSEQVRKLALLYAISENHCSPRVGLEAARWASRFVLHQTRRMLFMAASHVAESEFDALIKRTVEILRQWREKHGPNALMPAWELRRRLKQRPSDFKDIVLELGERRIVEFATEAATTKPKSGYRLL